MTNLPTPEPVPQPAQPFPWPVLTYVVPDKSVGTAYLLWFFFGVFGVHQFYLGKVGRGVGYLLTLGWFTVALWIDLFTLAGQVKQVNTQRRLGIR